MDSINVVQRASNVRNLFFLLRSEQGGGGEPRGGALTDELRIGSLVPQNRNRWILRRAEASAKPVERSLLAMSVRVELPALMHTTMIFPANRRGIPRVQKTPDSPRGHEQLSCAQVILIGDALKTGALA
jgi:hypothetical protein